MSILSFAILTISFELFRLCLNIKQELVVGNLIVPIKNIKRKKRKK